MPQQTPKLTRISTLAPSFKRYRQLVKAIRRMSLTRALQYEVLANYPLQGDVLDFGGGERALYREWLNCSSYQSININPAISPTWVVDVGDAIPCQENSFDTVLSLNTLEHIFDARTVIADMHRVLRPQGEIILSVPFLFPIHGHPDDYFRPTPSWYKEALGAAGFHNIEVTPLSWGPYTLASICSDLPGPGKGIRKRWALILDLLYHNLRSREKTVNETEEELTRFASAFFVRAVK